MILGLLAAAWFSTKPWTLSDVLLVSFALWTSLTHVRFLLFAALILIPVLAPHLQFLRIHPPKRTSPVARLLATAMAGAVLVWSFPSNAQLHKLVDSQFPRGAVAFLQQNGLQGRTFCAGPFSGYIEFYAPTMKTFADGRLDIFIYNGVIGDYLKINSVEEPLELLDKYRVKYVLYPVNKPLSYVLDRSPAWRVIYQDDLVKLYARNPADTSLTHVP